MAAANGFAVHLTAGAEELDDADVAGLVDALVEALPDPLRGAGVDALDEAAELGALRSGVAVALGESLGASRWWPAPFGAAPELDALVDGAEDGAEVDVDGEFVVEGAAEPDVEFEGLPEVDGLAVPVGVQVVGAAGAARPRKFRTAGCPSLATSVSLPPGIDTTIWSAPWTTTVASVTPVPLTRSSMIALAWFIDAADGVAPFGVRAVKVTCVPPTRSMPRRGVCRSPGHRARA
jgi:hypothetical protein